MLQRGPVQTDAELLKGLLVQENEIQKQIDLCSLEDLQGLRALMRRQRHALLSIAQVIGAGPGGG